MAFLTKKILQRKLNKKLELNQAAAEYEINKEKFCKTAGDAKILFEAGAVITKSLLIKLVFSLALVCIEALQKKMECK